MEPAEIFRDNVYRLFKQRGLVQTHVAIEIGERSQKLNSYLNGHTNWGETKRKKLADYLGVKYHELYNQKFVAETTAGFSMDEDAGADHIKANPYYNITELEHTDIIKRFKNKPLAKIINERLLNLENLNPAAMDKVLGFVEGLITGYQSSFVDRRKSDQPDKMPISGDRRKVG